MIDMKRLECLDGLRGLLAVYVMLSHMAPFAVLPDGLGYGWFHPGWLPRVLSHGGAAVDIFFILSGLVILRSLDGLSYRVRPFLWARVLRIFPAFLLVFAFAVAVQPLETDFARMPWIGAASPARDIWSGGWPTGWLGSIAAHLTMTHGLFPNAVQPDIWVGFLGAAWSLSVEWQFYGLIMLVAGPGREWKMAGGLLGLAMLALVWATLVPASWRFSPAFLPNKAHFFALGIASAALLGDRLPGRARLMRFAAVLGVTMAICLPGGIGKIAAPLIWTLCLAAQMQAVSWLAPLSALLRARILLWLGAVSFCLYLVNEPVQKLLGLALARLADGDAGWFTLFWVPLATLLPIVFAWWLHHAIEQPALRWGKQRNRWAARAPDYSRTNATLP